MAIRFLCRQCDQLLSIAGRKAGVRIECPKCGFGQEVPGEEAAILSLADQGDLPQDLDIDLGCVPPPLVAMCLDNDKYTSAHRTAPKWMVLLVLVAVIAFGAGYFIGRGNVSFDMRAFVEEDAKQQVFVEGKLTYDTGIGKFAPDSGAVVLFLPVDKRPKSTLSIHGLRPKDQSSKQRKESVQKVEAIGGRFAQVGNDGTFSLVLPSSESYNVLLISRHAKQPKDSIIDEVDMNEIQAYFYLAEELVGRNQYSWTIKEFNSATDPIEYHFGLDGR